MTEQRDNGLGERGTVGASAEVLTFGRFSFDTAACRLFRDGEEVHLTPKAAAVLCLLLRRPGELIGKDEFLEVVWEGVFVREESLTQAISVIRQTLADSPQSPRYIQTVSGEGYRFVGEVASATSMPPPSGGTSLRGLLGSLPNGGRTLRTVVPVLSGALAVAWLAVGWPPSFEWLVANGSPGPNAGNGGPGVDMLMTPVTSFAGEEMEAAMSPDGDWVAFILNEAPGESAPAARSARRALYVMQLGAGNSPRPLAEGPHRHAHPAWSPDGNRVAVVRWTPGQLGYEIVIKPLGLGEERLVYSRPDCRYPNGLDWSPDARYLAFPSSGGHLGQDAACPSAAGGPQGIVLLDLESDDVQLRQLTFVPVDELVPYMDSLPAFSPQGRMLAFRRSRPRGGNTELFVVSLQDSAEPLSLVLDPTPIQDLDWTRDGEEVVFAQDYSAAENFLRVVPADGSRPPTNLVVGVRARSLSIADRMNRLIYSKPQERFDLYRIGGPAAESPGAPVRLAASSNYDDWTPDFSPRGDQIAFASDRSGTWEIWVADFPGGSARPVTAARFAEYPQWSPDGEEIAYTNAVVDPDAPPARPPLGDVFIVDPDTGRSTNLTDSEFHDAHPGWGPRGEWIYFQSVREGGDRYELWRMPRAGGEAIKLTTGGDLLPRPYGGLLYFHGGRGRILSAALSGGDEKVFADVGVGAGNWDVWRGKLVYLRPIDGHARASIWIYDPETDEGIEHAPTSIAHWGVRSNVYNMPTVSPDGRWIVYSGSQTLGSDLILLDNFR